MKAFVDWRGWLFATTASLAVGSGAGGGDSHGDCLAVSGSCCEPHMTPGCENGHCCTIVCTTDFFCCDEAWDEQCVVEAGAYCGLLCTGGCPGEGDCCAAHSEAGCDVEECCSAVCGGRPWCCIVAWDDTCADAATQLCPHICPCAQFADLDGDGTVNLRDLAEFQNCFSGPAAPIDHPCACGDYDADNDVDLADYKAFQEVLAGP